MDFHWIGIQSSKNSAQVQLFISSDEEGYKP